MAQPYPPQGNQSPHTERPLKIYAEQYLTGQPVPVGVTVSAFPPYFEEGEPRVYLGAAVVRLIVTDWVISSRFTGKPIEVISAEEFAERFGPSDDPGGV